MTRHTRRKSYKIHKMSRDIEDSEDSSDEKKKEKFFSKESVLRKLEMFVLLYIIFIAIVSFKEYYGVRHFGIVNEDDNKQAQGVISAGIFAEIIRKIIGILLLDTVFIFAMNKFLKCESKKKLYKRITKYVIRILAVIVPLSNILLDMTAIDFEKNRPKNIKLLVKLLSEISDVDNERGKYAFIKGLSEKEKIKNNIKKHLYDLNNFDTETVKKLSGIIDKIKRSEKNLSNFSNSVSMFRKISRGLSFKPFRTFSRKKH